MSSVTGHTEKVRTGQFYQLVSASLAFALWGGWAWYVNDTASASLRLVASLTQGVASFLITLIIVRVVTFLFNRFENRPGQVWWPSLITISITAPCLVLAHSIAGTPEIAKTILPALTVALLYSLFTTWKLKQG